MNASKQRKRVHMSRRKWLFLHRLNHMILSLRTHTQGGDIIIMVMMIINNNNNNDKIVKFEQLLHIFQNIIK